MTDVENETDLFVHIFIKKNVIHVSVRAFCSYQNEKICFRLKRN